GEPLHKTLLRMATQARLPLEDLLFFTTQLTIMMETGSHLTLCLAGLEEQTENKSLKKAIGRIKEQVKEGRMLSSALADFPDIFDGVYVSMVRAGESGGALYTMLERLTLVLEKRDHLRSSLKSAMRYPMILLGIAGLVMIVMVTFLLPKFKGIFADMGAELPLATRILMGSSDFVLHYWYVLIGVAGVLAVGAVAFYHHPVGRPLVDRLSLRVPAFGEVRRTVYNSIILRLMGTLMESGVPLLEAIQIARGTVTNVLYENLLDRVVHELTEGHTFSSAIAQTDLIPAITKQMIRTGENSGMLGRVMVKIADYYDRMIDSKLDGLGKVLEPVMIVFMGGFVGFIAMSLLLPIFKMSSSVPH
ncbi:MAG: type II secretion system F family protein, partial [Candidatus Methylomirabilis sp.]|nr:type II secretion system F family protein [Deltaproteobacteria bacterium]